MPATAAVNALVPLPFNTPVNVVAPVPPCATATVVKPVLREPAVNAPTLVREDAKTPVPKPVAFSIETPLILKVLVAARSRCSLLVHASVASTHCSVLLVVPRRVMPPPSAPASVGEAVLPSSRFLSSTEIVVLLIVVVVPLTVRSPVTVRFVPTVSAEVITTLSGNPNVNVLPLVATSTSPAVPCSVKVPPIDVVTAVVVVLPPSGVATPLIVMLLLARALLGMAPRDNTPVVALYVRPLAAPTLIAARARASV